jgi:branched-chain amino acid transport system substrate-binding protein
VSTATTTTAVSGYEVFAQALEDNGVETLRTETFARGDVDFSPQLTNIIGDNPDAIVVSALVAEAVPIVIQARQFGYQGPIIGGNGFNSPALFEQAGEAAEGVIVGAAEHQQPSDLSVAFWMPTRPNMTRHRPAAASLHGAWLRRDGCADSADPSAVRDALAGIADYPTALGNFSFDEDRNPVHDPVVQIVLGGKFQLLSEDTATQAYGG